LRPRRRRVSRQKRTLKIPGNGALDADLRRSIIIIVGRVYTTMDGLIFLKRAVLP
jgi:hypothetical protein